MQPDTPYVLALTYQGLNIDDGSPRRILQIPGSGIVAVQSPETADMWKNSDNSWSHIPPWFLPAEQAVRYTLAQPFDTPLVIPVGLDDYITLNDLEPVPERIFQSTAYPVLQFYDSDDKKFENTLAWTQKAIEDDPAAFLRSAQARYTDPLVSSAMPARWLDPDLVRRPL